MKNREYARNAVKWGMGILALATLFGSFWLGRWAGLEERAVRNEESYGGRSLKLSATHEQMAYEVIPLEQGEYKEATLIAVKDVTIDIGGKPMPLKEALQGGYTTVDDIMLAVRKDAQEKRCGKKVTTKNGLTKTTYYYSDFRIRHIYDVYETPDGKKHFIADFLLFGIVDEPLLRFTDEENGGLLDMEDWGLEFTAAEVSPTRLTIRCTQQGGWALGDLVMKQFPFFILYELLPDGTVGDAVQDLTSNDLDREDMEVVLEKGTTMEIPIDLETLYGPLPPGDYSFTFYVYDEYDKDSVPPQWRKYHDYQIYWVQFTIPAVSDRLL